MKTIVVCESFEDIHSWSMRPFMEGIATSYNVRLIYRTFSTQEELLNLLNGEAFEIKGKSIHGPTFLYIGTHGYGGRIYPTGNGAGINLGKLATYIPIGIEGVWIGACSVGQSEALESFLTRRGSIFAGGYTCDVDWVESAMLDLAILQTWLERPRVTGKKDAISLFRKAFSAFSPTWHIGKDLKNKKVNLQEGFRVMARNSTPGATLEEVTDTIREKLRW